MIIFSIFIWAIFLAFRVYVSILDDRLFEKLIKRGEQSDEILARSEGKDFLAKWKFANEYFWNVVDTAGVATVLYYFPTLPMKIASAVFLLLEYNKTFGSISGDIIYYSRNYAGAAVSLLAISYTFLGLPH